MKLFKDKNDLSLRIEEIKESNQLPSYTEAVVWFYENETDIEMTDLVKLLNKKIVENIEYEAQIQRTIKTGRSDFVRLM